MIIDLLHQADVELPFLFNWIFLAFNDLIATARLLLFFLVLTIIVELLRLWIEHLMVDLSQVAEVSVVFLLHVAEVPEAYQIFLQ